VGDVDFTTWTTQVYRIGGVPTTWPPQFQDGHAGEPAARFTQTTFAAALDAGVPGLEDPATTRVSSSGESIYVLATAMTGGTNVVATSPHIATLAERAANAAFTAMGEAADTLHLPSTADLEDFLTKAGRDILIAGAAAVVLSIIVKRVL
jgi:hypothetical protein